MNHYEAEVRRRIANLVESVEGDQRRTRDLFHYVWTMMCVRQGLLRIVREIPSSRGTRIVLEEVRTGRTRLVSRPVEIDPEVEGLAVQALARILGEIKIAS